MGCGRRSIQRNLRHYDGNTAQSTVAGCNTGGALAMALPLAGVTQRPAGARSSGSHCDWLRVGAPVSCNFSDGRSASRNHSRRRFLRKTQLVFIELRRNALGKFDPGCRGTLGVCSFSTAVPRSGIGPGSDHLSVGGFPLFPALPQSLRPFAPLPVVSSAIAFHPTCDCVQMWVRSGGQSHCSSPSFWNDTEQPS
jgi:hypothetical protein